MQQRITSVLPREVYSTVTSKGQVTIPVEVRKHLGVGTNKRIAFVIKADGGVEVKAPKYPTLASLRGAAGKSKRPLIDHEMEEVIRDEVAEAYMKKFG